MQHQNDNKHTPGPWIISPASTQSATWDEIYSADMKTHICSMEMTKSRLVPISETTSQLEDTNEVDETIANAKLIASAPQLKAENEQLKEQVKTLREALQQCYVMAASYMAHRDDAPNSDYEILDSFTQLLNKNTQP